MGETLKRAISGAVYVILLLASILYSTESFLILFGIFLIISLFEFCNLIKVNKKTVRFWNFMVFYNDGQLRV